MIPAARVERTLDAPSVEACPTAGIHAALRGHAIPAGDRRRHGLLGQLGHVAAARARRPVLLPPALRDLRTRRVGRAARDVETRLQACEGLHAAPAGRRVRPHGGRQVAWDRRECQRRLALARDGACPVPAVRASEARADPLRGAAAGCAPELRHDPQGAGASAAHRCRHRLHAADGPARHGHRDGHVPGDRVAAHRRWRAEGEPLQDHRDPRCAGVDLRPRRALPARAPVDVSAPLAGPDRQRPPVGAGHDRDRIRRLLRRWPRRVGAEDLLPARGPHRHDPGRDRQGVGGARHLGRRGALRPRRLLRPARCEGREGPLRQASGRRDHGSDPVPGDAEPVRGHGHGAADRRPIAVHLVRQFEPDRGPRGRRDPAERGRRRIDRGAREARPPAAAKQLGLPLAAVAVGARRLTSAPMEHRGDPDAQGADASRAPNAGDEPRIPGAAGDTSTPRIPGAEGDTATPRIAIAAGGTAGHVVPALAVADALRERGAEVIFLGGERAEAELVPAAGYAFHPLKVAGIDRRNPLKAARAVALAAGAVAAARGILKRERVDAVIGGGGYVAGPAGAAALVLRLPLVLTEADSHLGIANRLLAPRARRVFLAFPIDGRDGDRYEVVGRPVPRSTGAVDRADALARFELPPDRQCLLVFGGSLGARTINDAAIEAFGATAPCSVLHACGRRDYDELRKRLDQLGSPRHYRLEAYVQPFADALAIADLAIARAGGSVFELAAGGIPSVLVPYPHATADHQAGNARWMAEGGAAVVVPDGELDGARLAREVGALLAAPERLGAMGNAARRLARLDAADRIASSTLGLARP